MIKKNDIKTSSDLFDYLIVQHVNRNSSGVYHDNVMKFIDDYIMCWVTKKAKVGFLPMTKHTILILFVSLANRYSDDKKSPTYYSIIKYFARCSDRKYANSFDLESTNNHSLRVVNNTPWFAGWFAARRCNKYTKAFIRALKPI